MDNDDNWNLDLLNIKYYTFFDGKIFGENYRKVNPKNLEIFNLLREKHDNIDLKIDNLDCKINKNN